MSGQTWTPAPRRGVVPLHPMTFGMILSKSFAMLRHNPRVLFGFAVIVELLVVLASAALVGFTLFATFSRLETLSPASPEYETVLAGTIAWNLVAGFVAGLISTAFIAVVQGLIAADVSYAALGVRATLRQLWDRVKPVAWRLVGYALLLVVVVFLAVIVIFGVGFGISGGLIGARSGLAPVAILFMVLLSLASIPLVIWLGTKIMLTPAAIVLEQATIRQALRRSWRLMRGRFWVGFGVMFLISMIMGFIAQIVTVPFALISGFAGTVIAPTGSNDVEAISAIIISLLIPQVLAIVIQAIAMVVQSSGSTLVYLDARMRYEGLDQTLLSYVERRDQGVSEQLLGDPFALDPARAVSKQPPQTLSQPPVWYPQQAYPYAQQQPYPGYPQQGYPAYPQAAAPVYQQPGTVPPPASAPPYAQPQTAQNPSVQYRTPGFATSMPAPQPATPSASAPPPPPAVSDDPDQQPPSWVAPGSDSR